MGYDWHLSAKRSSGSFLGQLPVKKQRSSIDGKHLRLKERCVVQCPYSSKPRYLIFYVSSPSIPSPSLLENISYLATSPSSILYPIPSNSLPSTLPPHHYIPIFPTCKRKAIYLPIQGPKADSPISLDQPTLPPPLNPHFLTYL